MNPMEVMMIVALVLLAVVLVCVLILGYIEHRREYLRVEQQWRQQIIRGCQIPLYTWPAPHDAE